MKISSFYMHDISEYENFIEKFIQDIDIKFYGTGFNSLNIGRFISFFRIELSKYINFKYNKKTNIIVTLPRRDTHLIEKSYDNSKECIRVYLSYDNVKSILEGSFKDYTDYVNVLIEQIDSVITSESTHEFNDYLILQMNNLAQLCVGELTSSYSKEFLLNNLKKPTSWIKLARQSSIFKDYYNYFKQDKENHKEDFIMFLRKVYYSI